MTLGERFECGNAVESPPAPPPFSPAHSTCLLSQHRFLPRAYTQLLGLYITLHLSYTAPSPLATSHTQFPPSLIIAPFLLPQLLLHHTFSSTHMPTAPRPCPLHLIFTHATQQQRSTLHSIISPPQQLIPLLSSWSWCRVRCVFFPLVFFGLEGHLRRGREGRGEGRMGGKRG